MTDKASKTLRYFFLILSSSMLLLSILMWVYFSIHRQCPSYFVYFIMLLPATAGMASKLLTMSKLTPARNFYLFYLTVVILMFFIVILSFILTIKFEMLCTLLITFGSIVGYFFLANVPKQDRISSGFNLYGNKKKMLLCILLFIVLLSLSLKLQALINYLVSGDSQQLTISLAHWNRMPGLLISFFTTYIIYLGEEYGWRYFLQSKLTSKYGMAKGILLVGIIWGLFHVPIDFIYNQLPPLALIYRLVVCISSSFFLGWVYVYTQNIWVVTFIHYLNNNLPSLWEFHRSSFNIFTSLAYVAVFLPFVFTKSLRTRPHE